MSEILVDNLTGKTAAGSIVVYGEGGTATINLQQGLMKSWVDFDGDPSITVNDSFSVSSISDEGSGNYHQNLSNNLAAVTGAGAGSASSNINQSDREVSVLPESTSHLQINTGQDLSANRYDSNFVGTIFAGDIA